MLFRSVRTKRCVPKLPSHAIFTHAMSQITLRRSLLASALLLALTPSLVAAKCGEITGKGDINIVGSAFPALQHIAREMELQSSRLKNSFQNDA